MDLEIEEAIEEAKKGYSLLRFSDRQEIDFIPVVFEPKHMGGSRLWLTCPGCGNRARVLFVVDDLVRCRTCHDLTYASCQARKNDFKTNLLRLRRIEEKFRRRGSVFSSARGEVPPRPSYMRKSLYESWIEEWSEAAKALDKIAKKILKRHGFEPRGPRPSTPSRSDRRLASAYLKEVTS